jgi:hypothetical protein
VVLLGGPRVVTPDGKHAMALRNGSEVVMLPLAGASGGASAPRPVLGFAPHEGLAGFDDEGHAIVYPTIGFPLRVALLDTTSGERRKLHDIALPEWETAGVVGVSRMAVTPDGRGYAYSITAAWGELHVASGIH